ncbi:AAA family ATPase [Inediibacterium massiliense]|uniref:AAA family ATPase n=1 Tax=Inediibacterium massiliense TaxID=1658111 RepID=UPI0006B649D8|nr:ATP-binding protein [Inediibacterium massiliense]
MLIQFNFKNFKGFRDEVSLDMTATSLKEHPYNLIDTNKKESFLKVTAIYGANGSGKSSVIQAFEFMRKWVLTSFKRESEKKGIPIKRFAFDNVSRKKTAEFEVFFRCKSNEYQYGFTVDDKKIHEEWLYKRDFTSKNKYDTLFERIGDKIECSNKLKSAENLVELVEESTLFLSIIASAKIMYAKEVFKWFLDTDIIDFGDIGLEMFLTRMLPPYIEEEEYLEGMKAFLKAVDINIDGIRVEKKEISDEERDEYKIFSKHLSQDKKTIYEIPFTEESSGTQKMFALYNFIISTIKNGNTLIVDELDAKLHPLLLRYVINMFHNDEINKKGAQLIYTTHDNYTLTREIFRRDQVWFVEKNEEAVSDLYSLAELKLEDNTKVRNDATYNKQYLLGRYGAVPVLRGFDMWRNEYGEVK